jgi:K+-transporting ATPase KdpF subunit
VRPRLAMAIFALVISAAAFIYLVWAMLRPEKF